MSHAADIFRPEGIRLPTLMSAGNNCARTSVCGGRRSAEPGRFDTDTPRIELFRGHVTVNVAHDGELAATH